MTFDNKTVTAAVKNMIDQYGGRALAEVDVRIEELKSLEHQDALELWLEVRKALCFKIETSTKSPKH
ncbi:MAG: hypothetical protein HON65_04885 [Rhodospirillales bacterium]|jgi:hypothetical protein|nr:hypothetical protein [Rhodospirillales bacterium]